MRNQAARATLLVILTGCRAHYSVKPATPHYLLKSPDGRKRAFPHTLSDFGNAFDGWIDLGPAMALKLENPISCRRQAAGFKITAAWRPCTIDTNPLAFFV